MKKKILSSLLLVAFAFAATSTVVSCKDYDDDIQKNTNAISALETQMKTLQTALQKAQGDATAAQATADQAVKDAAAAQKAADAAKATADAAKKLAEAAATKVEVQKIADAVEALQTLMDTKVDKAVYDKKVAEIAADIEAINGDLNKLTKSVSLLEKGLEDEAESREKEDGLLAQGIEAAKKDLQEQIDVLKAFKEEIEKQNLDQRIKDLEDLNIDNRIKALEGLDIATRLTNLEKGVDDLIKDLDAKYKELDEKISTEANERKQAITDLIKAMEEADKALGKRIDLVQDQINVMNVFLEKFLTSMVLSPEFYWGGIEAVQADLVAYPTLGYITDYDADKKNGVWISYDYEMNLKSGNSYIAQLSVAMEREIAEAVQAYNYDQILAIYEKYEKLYADYYLGLYWTGSTVPATSFEDLSKYVTSFAPGVDAHYHLNPSTIKEDAIIDLGVYSKDVETLTRAGENKIDVLRKGDKPVFNIADGMLNVELDINPGLKEFFAPFFSRFDATQQGGNSYGLWDESKATIFALQAEANARDNKTSLVTSDYALLHPGIVSNFVIADNESLYDTDDYAEEDLDCQLAQANPVDTVHVYTEAYEAIYNDATHEIAWNSKGVDLNDFVRVHAERLFSAYHRTGREFDCTDIMENKYGFKLEYTLIDYQFTAVNGTNETEQSSIHSTLTGSVLTPKSIDGKQNKSSIGREPLVRVELKDKDGKIVAIGFIKFVIVGDKADSIETTPEVAEVNALCDGYGYAVTWAKVEEQLLTKLNMSSQVFESVYRLENGSYNYDMESIETPVLYYKDANGEWASVYDLKGYFASNGFWYGSIGWTKYDDEASHTNIFYWYQGYEDIANAANILAKRNEDGELLDKFGKVVYTLGEADFNESATFTVAAKLVDKNKSGYPDIYIPFTVTVNQAEVNLKKNFSYWYNDFGKGEATNIRVNVFDHKAGANDYPGDFVEFNTNLFQTLNGAQQYGQFGVNVNVKNIDENEAEWNANTTVNVALQFVPEGEGYTTLKIGGKEVAGKIATGASGTKYFVAPLPINKGLEFGQYDIYSLLVATPLDAAGNIDLTHVDANFNLEALSFYLETISADQIASADMSQLWNMIGQRYAGIQPIAATYTEKGFSDIHYFANIHPEDGYAPQTFGADIVNAQKEAGNNKDAFNYHVKAIATLECGIPVKCADEFDIAFLRPLYSSLNSVKALDGTVYDANEDTKKMIDSIYLPVIAKKDLKFKDWRKYEFTMADTKGYPKFYDIQLGDTIRYSFDLDEETVMTNFGQADAKVFVPITSVINGWTVGEDQNNVIDLWIGEKDGKECLVAQYKGNIGANVKDFQIRVPVKLVEGGDATYRWGYLFNNIADLTTVVNVKLTKDNPAGAK